MGLSFFVGPIVCGAQQLICVNRPALAISALRQVNMVEAYVA